MTLRLLLQPLLSQMSPSPTREKAAEVTSRAADTTAADGGGEVEADTAGQVADELKLDLGPKSPSILSVDSGSGLSTPADVDAELTALGKVKE